MTLFPQAHTLKNGQAVTLRPPQVEEAQLLLDLKRTYIRNTTTIPLRLGEYPNDVSREKQVITKMEQHISSLLLIAEIDKTFIGNIDLTGSTRAKMAHTGMIGMGILEQWRNQGLGRILLESVIDWARGNTGLELIWLDVYASNALGLALYKNVGFQVSGVIEKFFKDETGYIDKVQMYIHL